MVSAFILATEELLLQECVLMNSLVFLFVLLKKIFVLHVYWRERFTVYLKPAEYAGSRPITVYLVIVAS